MSKMWNEDGNIVFPELRFQHMKIIYLGLRKSLVVVKRSREKVVAS